MQAEGVDCSIYQSPERCDWASMRLHGVRFSIARAANGTQVDPTFFPHTRGAKAAGLLTGAYVFLYPGHDPEPQIDAMAKALSTCPADFVALDCEASIPADMGPLKAADYYQRAAEYCAATLGSPLIYTYPFYLTSWHQAMRAYDLWISHVTIAAKPIIPKPWDTWTLWQWTGDTVVIGDVPGYPGHALRDRFNGDEVGLLGWAEGRG